MCKHMTLGDINAVSCMVWHKKKSQKSTYEPCILKSVKDIRKCYILRLGFEQTERQKDT